MGGFDGAALELRRVLVLGLRGWPRAHVVPGQWRGQTGLAGDRAGGADGRRQGLGRSFARRLGSGRCAVGAGHSVNQRHPAVLTFSVLRRWWSTAPTYHTLYSIIFPCSTTTSTTATTTTTVTTITTSSGSSFRFGLHLFYYCYYYYGPPPYPDSPRVNCLRL